MDTDQQQKNIDAAKAAQEEEGYVTYPTEDEDKIKISELRKVLGDDVDESKIDEAKESGNYINDED
ncbi:hypothetical protein SHJJP8909_001192 [Staphylococcus lugdunensis]|nr:hypothetical protein [Staphylococcus lugdunensis]MCH8675421.1 hypothetical protein [Staphylococcus lugdunensis]